MLTLPAEAQAGGRQQLDILTTPPSTIQWDRYLEKYNVIPWPEDPAQRVINPTSCSWDINDHSDYSTSGDLATGTSTSRATCVIEDYNPMYVARYGNLTWWSAVSRWFGAAVTSKSANLVITFSYAPQGRSFTLTPVYRPSTHDYRYSLCVQVLYNPGDPALVLIPGSTPDPLPWGSAPGEGVSTTITLTISNPTGSATRGVAARWGESSDVFFPSGCVAVQYRHPVSSDYPFKWYAGA
jgi:hypothetical protein